MPTNWQGPAATGLVSATAARRFDWVTDTMKIALLTSAYTPSQDVHDFYDDLTGEVANGSGYTTGGAAIGSKTSVYDSASNTQRLSGATTAWTFSASKTARYGAIYKDTGVGSTSPLLAIIDFGSDQTSSGAFSIIPDATDGYLRMVVT